MKTNAYLLAGVLALTGVLTQPANAAGNSFTDKIKGVWVGSGSIYRKPNAPRERVRCRFSSKLKNGATKISLRYICLGIDIKFETTGTLNYNQANGALNGKLVTVGIGGFKAVGKNKGNKVVLQLTGKDKETGKPVSGQLSLTLKGSKSLRSTLTATDVKSGKRFKVFNASFSR